MTSLKHIGSDTIVALSPDYESHKRLQEVFRDTKARIEELLEIESDLPQALGRFTDDQAVRILTIHKSKGLEYHTVIFVGLDDGAWWSFSNDEIEATAGFFVAFTRAKQRVIFTYCAKRGGRTKIATLYHLLQTAGVQITQIS